MRAPLPCVLAVVATTLVATPARAADPILDPSKESTLAAAGGMLAGLGLATFAAAGITYVYAASEAGDLDKQCPRKTCVERSPGAATLDNARDAEKASGILIGVGIPVMTAGAVLALYATAFPDRRRSFVAAPFVSPSAAGLFAGLSF